MSDLLLTLLTTYLPLTTPTTYLHDVSRPAGSEWELQLPRIVTRLVRVVGMGSLVKWQVGRGQLGVLVSKK